jgi:hypothetical protein
LPTTALTFAGGGVWVCGGSGVLIAGGGAVGFGVCGEVCGGEDPEPKIPIGRLGRFGRFGSEGNGLVCVEVARHWWETSQLKPAGQPKPGTVLQSTDELQPSETTPHWKPLWKQASEAESGKHVVVVQKFALHVSSKLHPRPTTLSQLTRPPQPSEMSPHWAPAAKHRLSAESTTHEAVPPGFVGSGTTGVVDGCGEGVPGVQPPSGSEQEAAGVGLPGSVASGEITPPEPALGNWLLYLCVSAAMPLDPAHFVAPQPPWPYAPTHGV